MHRGSGAVLAPYSVHRNLRWREYVPVVEALRGKLEYSQLSVVSLGTIILLCVCASMYLHSVFYRVQIASVQLQLRVEQDKWVASKCQDVEFRLRLPEVCATSAPATATPSAIESALFVIDIVFGDCVYMMNSVSLTSSWWACGAGASVMLLLHCLSRLDLRSSWHSVFGSSHTRQAW